jgi:hypothetical protein
LLYQKPEGLNSGLDISKTFVRVEIIYDIVKLSMAGLVAFY